MYDFLIGIAESIVRHGFSWSLAASVLFLILRQRKLKQKLKKHLPHLFADDEPNTHYINNQHIIMDNQRRMMERMGIECNVPTLETSKSSVNAHKTSYISSSVEVSAAQDAAHRGRWSYIKLNIRRKKNMKEYLKKLGRTKFQAFLILTISNITMLVLFFTGSINLEGDLLIYLPAINIISQLIVSVLYIWVEGGIDKANVVGTTNNVGGTTNDSMDFTQDTSK